MEIQRDLFHLAFPVHDLEAAHRFYIDGLGCIAGRSSRNSLILNLKGHQIVAQLTKKPLPPQKGIYPRHFGLIFRRFKDWQDLAKRAERKNLSFYQKSRVRYAGTPLEHHTFFLQDASGNLLEFKYYKNASAIFGKKSYRKVGDPR